MLEIETLVENYLHNRLSPGERTDFEGRLRNDHEFREKALPFLEVELAIQKAASEEDAARLRKLLPEIMTERKRKIRRITSYAVSLAAAVALIFAIFLFTEKGTALQSDQLFAQYYEAPSPPIARLGGGELLTKANLAFQQKDYQQAVSYYTRLMQDTSIRVQADVSLFLALSYLHLNQPDSTLLLAQHHFPDEDRSDWYRLLIYLKFDNMEDSRTLLQEILDQPDHLYYEKAREMQGDFFAE